MTQTSAGASPAPTAAARTRVVVVEDSHTQRRYVRAAVAASADLEVVGEARNGREAVALVARLRPAAVLMDLELPVMGGLEAIETIMAVSPTPILVYTGHADEETATKARSAGAVDVLAKPDGDTDLAAHAEQLRRHLRVAARVRVITHPRGRLREQGLSGEHAVRVVPAPRQPDGISLLAIGASTGGPQALLTLLKGLPADLPQSVLVVQHMAEGFIHGLASWLDQLVPLPVVVGGTGRLRPGTVTIAPSGGNLLVVDDRLRTVCSKPEPGQFHVPGIDQAFTSIAQAVGSQAVGVILTGMGRDGAAGLKLMRDTGSATLGQDEASSTVYGMPQQAFTLGAVERQLPIDEIAAALLELVRP